nr:hypothetical protein [Tanacetum cinerariifolium]GEZ50779.1 hypothetical protein [Tanacetum cinerariifolium]
ALDINLIQPPAFTPIVVGLHKEDQQATSGPTSLGFTSKGGANPQLSSAKSKARADSGVSAPKDSISQTTCNDEGPNKLSLDHISSDSPKDDEPIIFQDESDEEVRAEKSRTQKLKKLKSKAEAEVAFLIAQPSFSNVEQLTKLLVKSLKLELSTRLTSYDFSKSLATELKELLFKFNDLSRDIKEEDGNDKVITTFKANDLYLSEWRGVVKACPSKKGVGWSTIYGQIKKRMDYLHKTKAELGIDLEKFLQEQDPLNKLNELARKKRNHANDIHDIFRSTKKYKSSV